MEILFSRGHGASWVRQKALQVCDARLWVSFLYAVVHWLVERDEQVELIEERSKG